MQRGNLNDLIAFLAVARERSFTKAAAKLGVSQSALSHTVRDLEERLQVRLLTRTTRSVSPTEAGERLLRTIGPRLEEVEAAVVAVSEFRDKPTGTIRITAGDHPVRSVLWPKLAKSLPKYPDIKVELNIDNSLADIVAQRFDAGVRLGESVAQDMIAVPIGPKIRFIVVGAKSYFDKNAIPKAPQELVNHRCINLRLSTHGGIYGWEFEKDKRELKVRVDGQVTFNGIFEVHESALAGFGLAYVPEDMASAHITSGRLRRVLSDWTPPIAGYHLYYPSRRQPSAAFSLLLDALRHRR